jgi:hypothetical protein
MQFLNYDVQIKIFSFLQPEDIFTSYDCFQIIFNHLSTHDGFFVECTTIISNALIAWFQQKKIKLHLNEGYVKCDSGDQYWFRNCLLHRDNDLPAVIKANGDCEWYIMDERVR